MPWRHVEGVEVQFHSFLHSALDGGTTTLSHSGYSPTGKDFSVPLVSPGSDLDFSRDRKFSYPVLQSNHNYLVVCPAV